MIVQCGKSREVYVCTHVRKMSEMAIIAMQGTVHNTGSNEEHHVLSQNKWYGVYRVTKSEVEGDRADLEHIYRDTDEIPLKAERQ